MTEYGRGPGSEPWHPDDPLYGDGGWEGQQAQPAASARLRRPASAAVPAGRSSRTSSRSSTVRPRRNGQAHVRHPDQPTASSSTTQDQQQYAQRTSSSTPRRQQTTRSSRYHAGAPASGRAPAPQHAVRRPTRSDPYGSSQRRLRQPAGTRPGTAAPARPSPAGRPPPQARADAGPRARRQQAPAPRAAADGRPGAARKSTRSSPDGGAVTTTSDDDDDDDARHRRRAAAGGGASQGKKRRSGCACLVVALVLAGGLGGAATSATASTRAASARPRTTRARAPARSRWRSPRARPDEIGHILKEAGVVKSVGRLHRGGEQEPQGPVRSRPGVYACGSRCPPRRRQADARPRPAATT